MKETKKIKVLPNEEEFYINAYASFGWEVTSSQEVKVDSSHIENRGGNVYSVRHQENYVNVLLSRDNTIANYSKLCSYQNAFESADAQRRPTKSISIFAVLFIVPAIFISISNKKIKAKNDEMWQKMQNAMQEARNLQMVNS